MRKPAVLLILFAVVLLAVAIPAEAQQPTKVTRIGYLLPGNPTSDSSDSEAIRRALRELGYIEGQNIAFEYRYAEGKRDRFPVLAAELVRLKVDIIVVAGGNNPARALKNATKTIPIVMTGGSDPVEAGLIESFALLKEVVPKVARVAVLYDPANTSQVRELKEILPVTARVLKLTVQPWEIPDADGFERAFATFNQERPDGFYVLSGTRMWAFYKRVAGFVLKSRLPSIYNNREAVDADGLIDYGGDLADNYRRVAYYVDKILKGRAPLNYQLSARRSLSW